MGPAVQAAGVTGVPAVRLRKGKSRQPRTTTPPPPPKKLAGKGNAAAPQKAALGSPLREPRSPGTVPMTMYRGACRDRDKFCQERDVARVVAEAASRLKKELDTVKRQQDDLSERAKRLSELSVGWMEWPSNCWPPQTSGCGQGVRGGMCHLPLGTENRVCAMAVGGGGGGSAAHITASTGGRGASEGAMG